MRTDLAKPLILLAEISVSCLVLGALCKGDEKIFQKFFVIACTSTHMRSNSRKPPKPLAKQAIVNDPAAVCLADEIVRTQVVERKRCA